MNRSNIRTNSPMWYIRKYYIVAVFYLTIATILIAGFKGAYAEYVLGVSYEVFTVETVEPLIKGTLPIKKVVPIVKALPKITTVSAHFSRGSYSSRVAHSKYTYSETDVIMLASLLESECPSIKGWDRRLEANVVVNRHELYGGTLKSIIEAGNGRQFNGTWSDKYKSRIYSKASYNAAKAVLIDGVRVLDKQTLYFANLDYSEDTDFIRSVTWYLKASSKNGNSFGKITK